MPAAAMSELVTEDIQPLLVLTDPVSEPERTTELPASLDKTTEDLLSTDETIEIPEKLNHTTALMPNNSNPHCFEAWMYLSRYHVFLFKYVMKGGSLQDITVTSFLQQEDKVELFVIKGKVSASDYHFCSLDFPISVRTNSCCLPVHLESKQHRNRYTSISDRKLNRSTNLKTRNTSPRFTSVGESYVESCVSCLIEENSTTFEWPETGSAHWSRGYGKTSLIRVIPAQVRSCRQGHLCREPVTADLRRSSSSVVPGKWQNFPNSLHLPLPARGIAAGNMPGDSTAHSMFRLQIKKLQQKVILTIADRLVSYGQSYGQSAYANLERALQLRQLLILNYGQLWLSKLGRQRLISTRVREQVIHMTRGDTGKIVHNNTQINDHIFLEEVEFPEFETEIRENHHNDQHHQRRLERIA
ncbi:hypothetical protein J6590_102407 [Homalodisca vitripennis]|nr:hypothetical protein J6590_102407 [Homalodisca vitripennis]